ncbi:MAG: Arm DNA-binding domain-containing protein [Pseudomonadota bacterium]
MALSVIAINAAKVRDRPYTITHSDGLFFYMTHNGGRYWRMNYRYLGK